MTEREIPDSVGSGWGECLGWRRTPEPHWYHWGPDCFGFPKRWSCFSLRSTCNARLQQRTKTERGYVRYHVITISPLRQLPAVQFCCCCCCCCICCCISDRLLITHVGALVPPQPRFQFLSLTLSVFLTHI
ncbi:hypothetical protein BP00DRAFT_30303 [Aspergillus indologenus CBS 114.80]|uniref:Uncharacterized protein n=1 Tax=Aspergillus indologenus CBS 114.80 TaxID=1450541 RepID=A0A2V5HYR3_9EURO|nr:hypothetical protein BP00DRAFT_30303 [Aspergillus indologenus CBS 114.80]